MSGAGPLPTPDDFEVDGCLDAQDALTNFEGKSLDEAAAMFLASWNEHATDLMFMGPRAFAYYVRAAAQAIESGKAFGDAGEAIDALEGVLVFKLQHHDWSAPPLSSTVPALRSLCAFVLEEFERFKVPADEVEWLQYVYTSLLCDLEKLEAAQ